MVSFCPIVHPLACMPVQYGLVLRRFTFTTLVESDRTLPTCGASCRISSVLSVLSALLPPFRSAFFFSILVQFF
jgi:hypothetical protein